MVRKIYPFFFALFWALALPSAAQGQAVQTTDMAIDSLKRELARATHDTMRAIQANYIAFYYLRMDSEKALEYAGRALAFSERKNPDGSTSDIFPKGKASALYYMGWVYSGLGNDPEALRCLYEALALNEKIGRKYNAGNCLYSIGNVFKNQLRYDEAFRYFQEAQKVFIEAKSDRGLVNLYLTWAAALLTVERHAEALELYLETEKLFKKLNTPNYGGLYTGIGACYYKQKNYDAALAYYENAVSEHERYNDKAGLGEVVGCIGHVHLDRGEFPEALARYDAQLRIAFELKNKKHILTSYSDLTVGWMRRAEAAAASAEKDSFYHRALDYLNISRAYEDSIRNSDATQQVSELQVKFETARKEREISQLFADARTREIALLRQEAELRQRRLQAETARERALALEKTNANIALELELEKSASRERGLETDRQQQQIELLNRENALRETEVRQQRAERFALLVGLGALAVFAFFVLRLYFQKSASNRKIRQQQAEIEQQNARLADASRFKSIFLSNMSHEIRTPLNTIIGMSGLLADTPLSKKQREYAEVVKHASENLLAVINEILDFSKIEAGKVEFQPRPFDLLELLRRQIQLLRLSAEQKKLQLDLLCAPGLPQAVVADPGRLNQILLNLLGNAVKFTENGRVALHVARLDDAPDGRAMLHFEVRDTGIGIAPAELPHIFDAFQQAGENTHLRHSGTGLGLAITKQLVEAQGGQIRAESTLGTGSVLAFTLPVALADLSEIAAAAPAAAADGKLSSQRILLVEDNHFNQMLATELFQKLVREPHVVIAQNGLEAQQKATAEPFDLIFMDIKMPVMDGFAATRALREAGIRTPIIALTANATAEEKSRCLGGGMDDYLPKPIEVRLLREAMFKWMEKGGDQP